MTIQIIAARPESRLVIRGGEFIPTTLVGVALRERPATQDQVIVPKGHDKHFAIGVVITPEGAKIHQKYMFVPGVGWNVDPDGPKPKWVTDGIFRV